MLLFIAFRNLKRRRTRTIIAVFSVAIAVSLIVGTTIAKDSTIKAFRDYISNAYKGTDVLIYSKTSPTFNESEIAFLNDIQGIKVTKVLMDGIIAASNTNKTISLIRGINSDSDYFRDKNITGNSNLEKGEVIITHDLAVTLNITIGDNITLVSRTYNVTTCKVTGIEGEVKRGLFDSEKQKIVYMDLQAAQEFLNKTNQVSIVFINIENKEDTEQIISEIKGHLSSNFNVESPVSRYMSTIQPAIESFSIGLNFFSVFVGILAIILIANSMYMNVEERKFELGILRSMGFSKAQVLIEVLLETIIIGIFSVIVGLAIGLFLSQGIVRFVLQMFGGQDIDITLVISHETFTYAALLGLIVSICSGIIPAIHASRINIIEAIRMYSRRVSRTKIKIYMGAGILSLVVSFLPQFFGNWVSDLRLIGLVILAGVALHEGEKPISKAVGKIFGIPGIIGTRIASRHTRRTVLTFAILAYTLSFAVGISATQASWSKTITDLPGTVFTFDMIVWTSSPLDWSFKENLSKIEGVAVVAPIDMMSTIINSTNTTTGIIITDFTEFREVIKTELLNGSFKDINENSVVLFEKKALSLNVTEGDNLNLLTAENWHNFTVAAIMKSTGFEDFTYLGPYSLGQSIYITREAATKYFNYDGRASSFIIKVKEGYSRQSVANKIKEKYSEYSLSVATVDEIISQISTISNQIFAMFYAIIIIGLLLGGFGIFISVSQSVVQQKWYFGVLRSQGFSNRDIAKVIASESLIISITGFILALIDIPFSIQESIQASSAAAGILHLEYTFPWSALIVFFGVSILLGLLGAVKPIRTITKMNITEILRRE
ncbi:MAG: ABC transporter permease [Candidatus Odinarchaeota archaeon]|nr:ABC transporter permease [Candidatus Odinarchaeota archaeon]